jgi:hypothetical protein
MVIDNPTSWVLDLLKSDSTNELIGNRSDNSPEVPDNRRSPVQVRVRGYVCGVEDSKDGVRGSVIQGGESVAFYAKDEVARHIKQSFSGDAPIGVEVSGKVYAGRRFDTKEPDGTLTLRVDSIEPVKVSS